MTGRRVASTGRASTTEADAGSATVWAAFALGVLLLLAVAGMELGAAAMARERAESAADFAALAGAAAVLGGASAACNQARRIAAKNGVRLDRCELQGLDILVTVSVGAGLLGGRAVGRSRAGPAAD